jgi:hypothetical protein
MKEEKNPGAEGTNGGQGGGNDGHGHGYESKTVTIVVNGKPRQVQKNATLTFWDVIKLAFENPQTGDGIQYTVQYTRGEGNKPAGALVEGQSVKVMDGMEFDVTPTNRS